MGTNIRHRRTCTLLELTRTNVKVPWAPQASAGADVEGAAMRAASQSTMTVSESSLSIASRTALSRLSLVSASGASVKRNQEGAGEKDDGRQQQQQPCDAKATPAGPRLPYMPAKRRKLMVPTVHFANERTFLGWTHYALFLLNGATAVVRFGAGSPAMQLLRLLGVGVSVCAIGFLFVGLYVRERRRIKISWNPRQERMDSVLPLFVILFTVSFAVAVNWYAVYAY
ncbi:MAG: hypothetical protein BJ554DRAFT_7212 [Olpidium bornovanus]|uniref:DUF202 domain-containing protein n=1 Tax=Olpidium bornovanus TaxID=278681 RepID=A0A8H8DJM1_9FUNG|nr:MAG: hypothetical protein BJ554DRAFT_7212 [Olpidium bornovanus]